MTGPTLTLGCVWLEGFSQINQLGRNRTDDGAYGWRLDSS
jgi:hypothetical protein